MRAVAPRIGLPEIMVAENQLEYAPVCAAVVRFGDGKSGLTTRWRLTEAEREKVMAGEDIYLTLLTFGGPMQPVSIEVGEPAWVPGEAP